MPAKTEQTTVIQRAFSGRVYKSAPASGPVPSILTYPVRDYAGDEIRPGGGDWSIFRKDPRVNWTHTIPVGRGNVSLKALTLKGETRPVDYGETVFFQKSADLEGINRAVLEKGTYKPIGMYSVDECLKAAAQVERLVRDDVAQGVSIEFKANGRKGQAFWEMDEWSELEGRPCLHYEDWLGLAYAHAVQPINPGARTLLTSSPEHLEKAIRVAETGKIGSETLSPIVYKAFDPLRAFLKPANRTTVRVENNVGGKAMDELSDVPPVGGTVEMDEESTSPGMDGPTPAVKTCIEGAQMLLDLCDQLEASIGQSEHKKARKYVAKIIEELKATADEMNAMGETVRADIEGDKAEAEEAESESDETEAEEMDEDEEDDLDSTIEKAVVVPIQRDDAGFIVCKSFPNWKPRRFHVSEVKDPQQEDLAAQYAEAMAELNREQRKARPLIRAARANRR